MKLWDKGVNIDAIMEDFTVGSDRAMDLRLARWDVVASIAHTNMLVTVGLLGEADGKALVAALSDLLVDIDAGEFTIPDDAEDVHSHVERLLTEKLGDIGKRIHTGRSRNDQVLVDLKLFLRHELRQIRSLVLDTAECLLTMAQKHRSVGLPGYTHHQVAMPSSFGLWFGGYAEALLEDVSVLDMAIYAANANPLGSAAGYGSTFPLDREETTRALNFHRLHVTSTFAQMSRGRTEKLAALALGQVASTLARYAHDVVLYCSQNLKFISLPDEFTTGSSIMPHKKNPDIFEVLRSRCNRLQSTHLEINSVLTNLASGYHRDVQFIKETIIRAIDEMQTCLRVTLHGTPHIAPETNILQRDLYTYAYTVDRVDELVRSGIAFRDAYQTVASEVSTGTFVVPETTTSTHIGSIGNPGLEILEGRLQELRLTRADAG